MYRHIRGTPCGLETRGVCIYVQTYVDGNMVVAGQGMPAGYKSDLERVFLVCSYFFADFPVYTCSTQELFRPQRRERSRPCPWTAEEIRDYGGVIWNEHWNDPAFPRTTSTSTPATPPPPAATPGATPAPDLPTYLLLTYLLLPTY